MTTTLVATNGDRKLIGKGENIALAVYALQLSEMQAGHHDPILWDEVTRFLEADRPMMFSIMSGWRIERRVA